MQFMATATIAATSVGIHHVLIATDFSHQSGYVIRYGLDFVRLVGAQAEVAYVLPTEEFALAGGEGMLACRDAARRDLLELQRKLRYNAAYNDQTECHVTLLEGPVAECLLDCACQKKIDLIVVGTHGRGGVGKFLLGSVAEKIFRRSRVPVLMIGPNIDRQQRLSELHHVLAPCDLSPQSHLAMNYARALAAAHHSWLTVLNVAGGTSGGAKPDPERVKAGIRRNLAEIAGEHTEGANIKYRVEFGTVTPTILEVASQEDVDLVVLGVGPSSEVLDRFMWPIGYDVVRGATCPVLTIRDATSVSRQ